MSRFKRFKNYFFPRRRLWRDWRYWVVKFQLFKESLKAFPRSQEDILTLSMQYQKEHRYEREKLLLEHAEKLYPTWVYVLERFEWHSKPVFHPDPKKSKVQPRKLIYQERNPNCIPKQETLNSLCIVTGMSSNTPYFELGFQLIESLKATRFYKDIPIKILDCGLSEEDKKTLYQCFDVEIKNPGWDVDPKYLVQDSSGHAFPQNGWKGCTSRPYLHRHFPGFDYYCWIDADTWIKDETGLDELVCLAEEQGAGFLTESVIWDSHSFMLTLLLEKRLFLLNKQVMANGIFVASERFMTRYAQDADANITLKGKYIWGFDMIVFNWTLYQSLENPKWVYCYRERRKSGVDEKIIIFEGSKKFAGTEFLYLRPYKQSKKIFAKIEQKSQCFREYS